MSSTPRRNSPMVTEARKTRSSESASSFKNATTPRFALSPFRASLMTFVSIKYTARVPARLDPLEIRVAADRRHRRQNLREASPLGTRQRCGENRPMFASALRPCAPARSFSARTSSSSTPRTNRSAISALQTMC